MLFKPLQKPLFQLFIKKILMDTLTVNKGLNLPNLRGRFRRRTVAKSIFRFDKQFWNEFGDSKTEY